MPLGTQPGNVPKQDIDIEKPLGPSRSKGVSQFWTFKCFNPQLFSKMVQNHIFSLYKMKGTESSQTRRNHGFVALF